MSYKYAGKGINIITGFDVKSATPLDSRTVVADFASLATVTNVYEGLTIYVESEKKKYTYVANSNYTEGSSEPKFIWRADISIDDTFVVIDDLTSESKTDALSAYQGKVLKDKQDEIDGRVTTLEGEMDTAQADIVGLRTDVDKNRTDIDTVTARVDIIDGNEETEGSFRNAIKNLSDSHDLDINALDARVTENEKDIVTLQGETSLLLADSTVEGSVKEQVATATSEITKAYTKVDEELDAKITAAINKAEDELAAEATRLDGIDSSLNTKIDTLETNLRAEYIAADKVVDDRVTELTKHVDTNTKDIETIANSLNATIEQVNKNTSGIATLNADASVEGSVDNKIAVQTADIRENLGSAISHKSVIETVVVENDGQRSFTFGSNIGEGYLISNDTVKMIVNAMTYVEVSAFQVNRLIGLATWTLTESNGGFNLETDDVVQIEYSIRLNASPVSYYRVDVNRSEILPTTLGDFDEDPTTYSEQLSLADYDITNFHAIVINGITYSGSQVSYDAETQILTLNGLRTANDDSMIVISYEDAVEEFPEEDVKAPEEL